MAVRLRGLLILPLLNVHGAQIEVTCDSLGVALDCLLIRLGRSSEYSFTLVVTLVFYER